MSEHRESRAALTVAVQTHETEIGSGVLELEEGRVTSYVEKPVLTHLVSLGIYALDPRALAHLPEGHVDIPTLVAELLAAGEAVHAYHFDGYWYDIGTIGDHEAATAELAANPHRYLSDLKLESEAKAHRDAPGSSR